MSEQIGQTLAEELRRAAAAASEPPDTASARATIRKMRKTTREILEALAVGHLALPSEEAAQASEILDRVEKALSPLEERTQRLMRQYGL